MINTLDDRVKFYKSSMGHALEEHQSYFSSDDLLKLHQKQRNDILSEIQTQADSGRYRMNV